MTHILLPASVLAILCGLTLTAMTHARAVDGPAIRIGARQATEAELESHYRAVERGRVLGMVATGAGFGGIGFVILDALGFLDQFVDQLGRILS